MDNLLFWGCEPHVCLWWKKEREFLYLKKSLESKILVGPIAPGLR